MTETPNRRKRVRLNTEWRTIVRHAWSMRFGAVAVVFSIAEVAVPLYQDAMPRGVFAALSGLSMVGGMIARLLLQKDMK